MKEFFATILETLGLFFLIALLGTSFLPKVKNVCAMQQDETGMGIVIFIAFLLAVFYFFYEENAF